MKKRLLSFILSGAVCLGVSMPCAYADVVLKGDVNGDGEFSIADVVSVQRWLLGDDGAELVYRDAADFCEDRTLDVFDLCLMKRALMKQFALNDEKFSGLLFGCCANNAKPLSPVILGMKCSSFCESGSTLKIDAAMGDVSLSPSDYELKGNYRFSVYAVDELFHTINDDSLIVNGNSGEYLKEYAKEDAALFDIGRKADNYNAYHHESAEIDFSKYAEGSSGCIAFSLSRISADPDFPDKTSSFGSIERLFFYVGSKGTGISNISVEDAKNSYIKLTS